MLIELRNAVFGYSARPVVQVNLLHLHAGRCLGVFGANGSGKTTLVRGMTGLLRPLDGSVSRLRDGLRIGYLPQHRGMDLHWPMTAFDAASLAVSAGKPFGWLGSDARRVREQLTALGLIDVIDSRFATLSGGLQQRVLLAGVLAAKPDVLVLDEPTDGLDAHSRQMLLSLLKALIGDGLSIVLISHDLQDLFSIASDVAWLHPPTDPRGASRVELIAVKDLADRLIHPQVAS